MTDDIGPLVRLFREMADHIDNDRTSQTRYQAIVQAAAVVAARAATEGAVSGRLWDTDGADLLAAAYGFHAGLSPEAAVADHVSAVEETEAMAASGQREPSREPVPPRQGGHDAAAMAPRPSAPARSRPPPVDPHALPGPRLGELEEAEAAGLWALLGELRHGEVTPRGQLIRLTRRLPAWLAAQLLATLEGGPALVRAEAMRVLDAITPAQPATPVLAVVLLGWLEAAEQVLAAGGSPQELQLLLGAANRRGNGEQ
jgi:hypothetical protein